MSVKKKDQSESARQLRVYSLPEEIGLYPLRALLLLNVWLFRSFFGAILNGVLLVVVLGVLLMDGWTRGSAGPLFWILGQLFMLPSLMAGEEFLHLLVFLQKGFRLQALDLVVVYKITAKGKRLICYGGAVRFKGLLRPMDKIHISAPGPLVSLLLAVVVWSVISLRSGSIFGELIHLQSLPIMFYLLSSLWPFNAVLPTDLSNILRARKEGHYGLLRTLGACLASLRLIWVSLNRILRRS